MGPVLECWNSGFGIAFFLTIETKKYTKEDKQKRYTHVN